MCFNPSCVSYCCGPYWSLPYYMTEFRIIRVPIISHPQNHLMVHREEPHLDGCISEVWSKGRDQDEKGYKPVRWSWCTGFNEDLIGSGWEGRGQGAICQLEYVPKCNTTPDEDMLYVCEVVNGQCHLTVHHTHYTSVHGGAKDLQAGNFSAFAKCLSLHCPDAEEEDQDGT